MIRLFLANIEVELNESVSFAITKQFEDITSPADIKNDYSKTVNIPFTQKNNRIFGYIFNVDRLIIESDSPLMGIRFDPYKKIDFRLQWCDAVLLQGYAKILNIIKESNGKGHYSISLNGELGKVFQEMKKITFDTSTDDTKYLIDGGKYISETINKDLIYNLWTNEPDFNETELFEVGDSNYSVNNILGFVPNNSFNEDFDYKTYQVDSYTSEQFTKTLNNKASEGDYETLTGIDADTIIGNGLLPRTIGEFRSYLQLPYIYFNKLFKILLEKTKQITGYDYELDKTWFSVSNPYWSKLVYMLKPLDYKDNIKTENIFNRTFNTSFNLNSSSSEVLPAPNTYTPSASTPIINVVTEQKTDFSNGDRFVINQDRPIVITLTTPKNSSGKVVNTTSNDKVIFNNTTALYVIYYLKDENNNVVSTYKNMIIGDNYNGGYISNDWNIIRVNSLLKQGEYNIFSTTINSKMKFIIDKSIGSKYTIECSTYFASDIAYYFYLNEEDTYAKNRLVFDNITISEKSADFLTNLNKGRSGYKFTMNDIWDNEYNLFEQILNYCKMYRIGIFCDDINKKLVFKPLQTYFSNYKVLDWTDKLDLSKEYYIQPITFENKYVLFNYEGIDTEVNKKYSEKFGVNYGEYKLITDYEFNNETKKLFNKISNGIPLSEASLSWESALDKLKILYILPTEIMLNNKDKDNKFKTLFSSLFMYNGLGQWDVSSGLNNILITDDTSFQIINNLYFYTQTSDNSNISVSTYPILDITSNQNICLFKTPAENYTFKEKSYDNTKGIYDNFWQKYLGERYNKQNKIVTCYLRLTPYDMLNFEYNNFVQIENQLYMVNKIYDYKIDENVSTKVDLITIQDIEGYTESNFRIFNIYFKFGNNYELYDEHLHYIDINQHSTYTIYITSNVDIHWQTDSGLQQNIEVNGEVSYGRIPAGDKVAVDLFNDEYGPVEGYLEFNNGRDTQKIFVRVR